MELKVIFLAKFFRKRLEALNNFTFKNVLISLAIGMCPGYGWSQSTANQTDMLSQIYSGEELPFSLEIETADFQLPFGIHSFVSGNNKGKWIFLAGRRNGMHTFNDNPDNFPPSEQNDTVIVVDSIKKKVYTRSLRDPDSGLTLDQIESLSVTSPQFYQVKVRCGKSHRIYMSGGYGFSTTLNDYTTWPLLTAIDMEGLIHWVVNPSPGETAAQHIRQTSHPMLAVTGGYMDQLGGRKNPTLLCLGQDFEGPYFFGINSQWYTEQVRTFYIKDDASGLSVKFKDPKPFMRDPNLRRRDLNICRVLRKGRNGNLIQQLVAFSGVFTKMDGIWTVPVSIFADGQTVMQDPTAMTTFKQGMSNYACANVGLYSRRSGVIYNVFLGGISYGVFSDGNFVTDPAFPFTNQISVISSSNETDFKQYFVSAAYPVILSTSSNFGNPLLFGSGAQFIREKNIPEYLEEVLKLDKIKKRTTVGYIVGGIQSTVPNTETASDSAASPYIFKLIVNPDHSCGR